MNRPRSIPLQEKSALRKPKAPARPNWTDYAPAFNRAMLTGLKIEAVLGILSGLVLDMGGTWQSFRIALLAQWATVFIILWRRPMTPTELDLEIVRYGIVPLVVIVNILGPSLLRAVGILGN